MTDTLDPKLVKRALEVTDNFRKFYPQATAVILTHDTNKWAGMRYTVHRDQRIYCVGSIPEKPLYHLPDSELEWYASNTTKEAITPTRVEFHPWGPSFQLMGLSKPETEQELALYEREHSNKKSRVLLGLHLYNQKLGRWSLVKADGAEGQRAWPFAPVESEPVRVWQALQNTTNGQEVWVYAGYDEALSVLTSFGELAANWQLSPVVGNFPPNRRGQEVHAAELFSWVPRKLWPRLHQVMAKSGTSGLVLYLNRELNSGRGPEPVIYPFGEAWTMKDTTGLVDQVGETPSQFRYKESFCVKNS